MPRSMTGIGRAELKNESLEIDVEIRNLNNRFLDIHIKIPKTIATLETQLKEQVKKKVNRGKITVQINFKNVAGTDGNIVLNTESLSYYYDILQEMQKKTGVSGDITLDHLLQFKDLLEPQEAEAIDSDTTAAIFSVMQNALDQLNDMRIKEAANLCKDILDRINMIQSITQEIKAKGEVSAKNELLKLSTRIEELVSSREIDRNRLEMELALIADRVDITEECTRLDSHLQLFHEILNSDNEVGKRLNFLLQEMQRETNTIGSKTSDITISHSVIKVKEEIEKLREQVQNLE